MISLTMYFVQHYWENIKLDGVKVVSARSVDTSFVWEETLKAMWNKAFKIKI